MIIGGVLSIVNNLAVSVLGFPAESIKTTFPSVTSVAPPVMFNTVALTTSKLPPKTSTRF